MEEPYSSVKQPPGVIIMLGLLIVVLMVGMTFYHFVEGFSFVDAFYFTAMTLTTVGYGDFTPQTDAGKIFTVCFAFIGVGIFLGFAGAVLRGVLSSPKRFHRKGEDQ